jgi:DnaJ-class molecular chaperone
MATTQHKDYYKTLGVDRNADQKTLREAYRRLARKYHPDVNPGDKHAEERFKEINEAYEVLSDPAKRKIYDRLGAQWQRYRDAGVPGDDAFTRRTRPGSSTQDFTSWFTDPASSTFRTGFGEHSGSFAEFVQTLFGNLGRRGDPSGVFSHAARRRRGEDVEVELEISFDEAFTGTTRRVDLQAHEPCSLCKGSGLARGAVCPACDGAGVVKRAKTIEVKIPAGVATGSRVRVAGQGGSGRAGGPSGDVYLKITVRPDPRFERDHDDLKTEVDVPLYTAVLGGEVVVSTPKGKVALTIPPETQSGRIFRLRGQGMPKLRGPAGERGDLLVRVKVVLPSNLSEHERALFRQLRDLRSR